MTLLALAVAPAHAASPEPYFNIPSQPLVRALPEFGRQAGVQVVAPADGLASLRTAPVVGRMTYREALGRLLQGARLAVVSDDGRVVTLAPSASRPLEPATWVDEIVVTSLRRTSSSGDTPMSLTALSGENLSRRGVTSMRDMAGVAPGLTMTEVNTGQRRISMRGVQSAGESTVGLYLGETPVTGPNSATSDPSSITPDLNMFDVSRVEVLRGPQGTLFGSGSMSGTFRMLFNEADPGVYEGAVDVTATSVQGGGEGYGARGMVNVPLVQDVLAARLVLYDEVRPGYVDNIRLGQANINEARSYGGRLMLTYLPSQNLRITGMVTLQNQLAEDTNAWFPELGDYNTDNFVQLPFPNNFRLYNVAAEWDLGAVTFNASSSYYDWRATKYIDGSWRALYVRERGTYCSRYVGISGPCDTDQLQAYRDYVDSVFPLTGHQPMWVETWTHEARLSSNDAGPLQWTVGAFLEDRKDWSESTTVQADPATGHIYQPRVLNFARTYGVDLRQSALFGEVSYRPAPPLTITAGARRYDYEKIARSQVLMTSYLNASVAGPETVHGDDVSGWVGRINISYALDPHRLIYVQYAEGYRPGGINNTPGLTPDLIPYASDSLESLEVGFRAGAPAGRWTLNTAIYEIRWRDMQIAATIPNFSFITNVGAAVIRGGEIEAAWRPMNSLVFEAGLSFQDGRLAADQAQGMIVGAGLAGDRIPFEPRLTASASIEYLRRLFADVSGRARLDLSHTGRAGSAFRPNSPYYEQMGGFTLGHLRLSLETEAWAIEASLDNILNEVGLVNVTSRSEYERLAISTQPRTFGIRLKRWF